MKPLRRADNAVVQLVPNVKERMEALNSTPLRVFMICYEKDICVWESSLRGIYTLGFVTPTRVLTAPYTLVVLNKIQVNFRQ